jgi:hypothetical protein
MSTAQSVHLTLKAVRLLEVAGEKLATSIEVTFVVPTGERKQQRPDTNTLRG